MLFVRLSALALAVASVAACGADDDAATPKTAEPDPKAAEVRERCGDFAARLCASAASCCESTGSAFSPERCAASFAAEFCGPAAAVVGEGRAEYHPEAEEPCLAAWARAHETCVADWQEIVEIRRDVWAACKMVRGTSPLGSGCSTSSSCEQPEGDGAVRCLPDPVTRMPTCQVLEILGEGAACRFPSGEVSVCDTGLYCTTTELDGSGTCEPAVPEGGACDTSVPGNPECGLGSYCGSDGVCGRATNFGGPSCEQGAECVSFSCEMTSAGGSCRDALSTAADLCDRGAEP